MSKNIREEERHEAATVGCPSRGIPKLPGGFDGTEPAKTVSEEAQAKIEQCVIRQRQKLTQIADLALAAEAKSVNADVKLGSKYLENSDAIAKIRRICKESAAEEICPDYEWLAKIVTGEHFEPECLAKAIEAEASKRPIEYPTFYTPGWLCELAKKLQANGTVPSASSPTGADKAAKTAEYMRRKYSFCDGLFPIRRANCEKAVTEHCWIGGRRFTMEMSEDIHDHGLTHVCSAKIRDNGKLIAKLVVNRGKSMAEHMAHATFKAYVKNLSGSNRLSSRGGFLKQAVKRERARDRARAAKQQAHDNKGNASTHS